MKKNNNIVTLSEQEAKAMISNLVSESMEEMKLNPKHLAAAGALGAGALFGGCNGCDIQSDADEKESQEMFDQSVEDARLQAEFEKNHPTANFDDFRESRDLNIYNANRKYKLTESQLNQLVTESVYKLLNEASVWQGIKSFAKAIPQGFSSNYNGGFMTNLKNNLSNYDAQNADQNQQKINTQIQQIESKYNAEINKLQAEMQAEIQKVQNSPLAQKAAHQRDLSATRRQQAKTSNGGKAVTKNVFKPQVQQLNPDVQFQNYRQQQQPVTQQPPNQNVQNP